MGPTGSNSLKKAVLTPGDENWELLRAQAVAVWFSSQIFEIDDFVPLACYVFKHAVPSYIYGYFKQEGEYMLPCGRSQP
jgi:hypothetical protein